MTEHISKALKGLKITDVTQLGDKRAAFLGCGDSLAAARPAENYGHRVISSGDVAWSDEAPAGVDVAVALSWSGNTGATIQAAEVCKAAGLPVIALTSNGDSPLADVADETVVLPAFDAQEVIPALGYIIHSAAVNEMCTGDSIDLDEFAQKWEAAAQPIAKRIESWATAPQGITVVSMPDVRGSGEFWMLKLIEALGMSVRWAPVEEVGHVDYFIGPQMHVDLLLSGEKNPARLLAMGDALERNGQTAKHVHFEGYTGWALEILGGALGADWAEALAHRWGKPPFRGHVVDMSARHIQVPKKSN